MDTDGEEIFKSRQQKQLARENRELKSRCKFLEKDQQRNKHLASEWQDFGRYTAHVLKNEVETATTKIKYLEVRVEDLRKENKELKDVCLYLDQSQTGESKLTPPELSELLARTNFLSKLNLKSRVPHFGDSLATLQAGQNTMVEQLTGKSNITEALVELGRRVESLEKEKLELIKSLSAAHLLVANTNAPGNSLLFKGAPTPRMIEHPPKLDTLLQTDEPDVRIPLRNISPEIVTIAVMLLDIIQRLDAAEVNGFSDSSEEAEMETLRVLIAIAWQKIQEQIFMNT